MLALHVDGRRKHLTKIFSVLKWKNLGEKIERERQGHNRKHLAGAERDSGLP
jgi:hypothetical protein